MSYYLMHRGWMEDKLFEREPFDRRSAWAWLMEHAAFADAKQRGHDVKRGQIYTTLGELSKAWGWQRAKVQRFLCAIQDPIQTRYTIECISDTDGRLITICNYDDYQFGGRIGDTPPDTLVNGIRYIADTHNKESKEEGIKKVGANAPTMPARARAPRHEAQFAEWWDGYPHKVGKGDAQKAFEKALTKTSFDQLVAGIERYKATKPLDRAWCNPATWLNQERWLDAPAPETDRGTRNGHHKPTAANNLFEGAWRAAEASFARERARGEIDEPLLEGGRPPGRPPSAD